LGDHSRPDDHYGTQDDTTITLAEDLGRFAAGNLLSDVLAALYADAEGLQTAPQGRFSLSAFIRLYFKIDAVIKGSGSGSFGIDAWFARAGSFSINALFKQAYGEFITMDAYITSPYRNVVMSPIGATATYTAISSRTASTTPDKAANSIVFYDGFGDAWEKAVGGWVTGDWWQVAWNAPQTLTRVILYGARQSDGTPLSGGVFGTSGRLVFSDGSTVNWSGWSNNQNPLTIDFSSRTVSSMRVISDVGGGSRPSLAEVEAFDMDVS